MLDGTAETLIEALSLEIDLGLRVFGDGPQDISYYMDPMFLGSLVPKNVLLRLMNRLMANTTQVSFGFRLRK